MCHRASSVQTAGKSVESEDDETVDENEPRESAGLASRPPPPQAPADRRSHGGLSLPSLPSLPPPPPLPVPASTTPSDSSISQMAAKVAQLVHGVAEAQVLEALRSSGYNMSRAIESLKTSMRSAKIAAPVQPRAIEMSRMPAAREVEAVRSEHAGSQSDESETSSQPFVLAPGEHSQQHGERRSEQLSALSRDATPVSLAANPADRAVTFTADCAAVRPIAQPRARYTVAVACDDDSDGESVPHINRESDSDATMAESQLV